LLGRQISGSWFADSPGKWAVRVTKVKALSSSPSSTKKKKGKKKEEGREGGKEEGRKRQRDRKKERKKGKKEKKRKREKERKTEKNSRTQGLHLVICIPSLLCLLHLCSVPLLCRTATSIREL
jgi:hypothetical protein